MKNENYKKWKSYVNNYSNTTKEIDKQAREICLKLISCEQFTDGQCQLIMQTFAHLMAKTSDVRGVLGLLESEILSQKHEMGEFKCP